MKASRLVLRAVLAATVVTAALASCGNEDPSQVPGPRLAESEEVSEGELGAQDAIPRPKRKSILSISGLIANTNDTNGASLDIATLEMMPRSRITVLEPFEKERIVFEGVLMSDLMEILGADSSATTVRVTARDDYEIDLSMGDFEKEDVLLATRADGAPMSVVAGGPTRIVFPENSEVGYDSDMWIWNVDYMIVR